MKARKIRKIRTIQEWVEHLGLPEPKWRGADSFVWDRPDENVVMKLMCLYRHDVSEFIDFVRNDNTGCPIVPIISCKPLGFCRPIVWDSLDVDGEARCVLFKIVQERAKVVAIDKDDHYGEIINPGCNDENLMPPDYWLDVNGECWVQEDNHQSNASADGRWLDLCRIYRRRQPARQKLFADRET